MTATNTGLIATSKPIPKIKEQSDKEAMFEFRQLEKKKVSLWSRGLPLPAVDEMRLRQLIARFNPENK